MPNRRIAIQQLLLIWAGVALLPSCLQNEQKVSIPLKMIRIDPDDESMLAELAETILPKTDTPGAKDLSAHLFALKMVDDCYSKVNQEKYIRVRHLLKIILLRDRPSLQNWISKNKLRMEWRSFISPQKD